MTPFLKISLNGDTLLHSSHFLDFLSYRKYLLRTRFPDNEMVFYPSQTKVMCLTLTRLLRRHQPLLCVWVGGGEGTGAVTRAAASC